MILELVTLALAAASDGEDSSEIDWTRWFDEIDWMRISLGMAPLSPQERMCLLLGETIPGNTIPTRYAIGCLLSGKGEVSAEEYLVKQRMIVQAFQAIHLGPSSTVFGANWFWKKVGQREFPDSTWMDIEVNGHKQAYPVSRISLATQRLARQLFVHFAGYDAAEGQRLSTYDVQCMVGPVRSQVP
jgi:hypothetical protein